MQYLPHKNEEFGAIQKQKKCLEYLLKLKLRSNLYFGLNEVYDHRNFNYFLSKYKFSRELSQAIPNTAKDDIIIYKLTCLKFMFKQ